MILEFDANDDFSIPPNVLNNLENPSAQDKMPNSTDQAVQVQANAILNPVDTPAAAASSSSSNASSKTVAASYYEGPFLNKMPPDLRKWFFKEFFKIEELIPLHLAFKFVSYAQTPLGALLQLRKEVLDHNKTLARKTMASLRRNNINPYQEEYTREMEFRDRVSREFAEATISKNIKDYHQSVEGKKLKETQKEALLNAARNGHVNLLNYFWNVLGFRPEMEGNWLKSIDVLATEGGHLNVLEWLTSKHLGPLLNPKILGIAAENGHKHIVQWFLNLEGQTVQDKTYLTLQAAKGGKLEFLKWLLAEGCPLEPHAFIFAAQQGHVHVLEWLIDSGRIKFDAVRWVQWGLPEEGKLIPVYEWLRKRSLI